jgi:hypothetical protein
MKVYKYGPENFPLFMFIYEQGLKSFYDTLRVKSGLLRKWSFKTVSIKAVKDFYEEYKGDFPPEVKKEAIYGIFGRKSWN